MSRSEARSELIRIFSAVMLGPMEEQEIISSAPADTYLTGILWPQGEAIDAIEDDDTGSAQDEDVSTNDSAVPGYRSIRPCSIGITFAVNLETSILIDLGTTSRYLASSGEREEGNVAPADRKRWARAVLGYSALISASSEPGQWKLNRFSDRSGKVVEDSNLYIHIKRRVTLSQQIFTVTLVNSFKDADRTLRDQSCLFQSEIIINAADKSGNGAIHPRPSVIASTDDEDTVSAALLYRDVREFAVGHGIGAMWNEADLYHTREVRTAWLPRCSVKGTSASGHKLLADFTNSYPMALDASWLGREDAQEEVIPALEAFAAAYGNWIDSVLVSKLEQLESKHQPAAQMNLSRCRDALRRIGSGIEILRSSEHAWIAFALANTAMNRQAQFKSKEIDSRRPLKWRPFQLAYILLVLPGLVDYRQQDRDCMDLLWFPTGGGKTEAYLGLTAFEIFFRRLESAARRAHGGVDVLMRYTLRLLTVQQFQRAAALICSCDAMREERTDLGSARITLGLYVGGDATPNRTADAEAAIVEELEGNSPRSTPRQLLHCPVCGEKLAPSCYSMSTDGIGVDIRCMTTDCPTNAVPLPVSTIDDAICRAPPSLLIGTIDKFAQLPRRTDIRSLFGLDGELPPGLIIQDELHLISGPLGSIAGLYETAIDMLSTRGNVRPKVIGSTATIGQAARQVRALFDRSVLQFPPAGFDASDSFFAVRDTGPADRIYLGVSSAGRSPKFALQATAAALLQAAAVVKEGQSFSEEVLDAYWTCVLYFNSLRELGSAYVLMLDDVPRQMAFLASRLGVERRVLEQEPIELSSRVSSRELPEKLQLLKAKLETSSSDPYAIPPIDTVLASNMISVGVDVPRLGLMIVNGQPKSTAEYIQASSRVGRGIEGLVVTVYNFGRPRDLSHFEHFASYHSALYRGVEATSVTPWAPRARDKALHAVVAGIVRHLVDGMDSDEAALQFDANNTQVRQLIADIAKRAASASGNVEAADTLDDIIAIVRKWARRGQDGRSAKTRLLYWERKAPFGKTAPHLMYSAEESGARSNVLAWSTPNSMRDVEPSTAFKLKIL